MIILFSSRTEAINANKAAIYLCTFNFTRKMIVPIPRILTKCLLKYNIRFKAIVLTFST